MKEEPQVAPEGPGDARPYLRMIERATEYFRRWRDVSTNIDNRYAQLERMAGDRNDRELQVFWANMQVLGPTIYSRAAVPVVGPRFRDRKPVVRAASSLLERALLADAELDDMHEHMLGARDDLIGNGRGVMRVYLGERDGGPAAISQHMDRDDFLHEPAREWSEVGWVAFGAWLDKGEVKKRFGRVPEKMQFDQRPLNEGDDSQYRGDRKARIWEIWHKGHGLVCWVSPGVEELLDSGEPEVSLRRFFPCPRPAYGTLQRRTLIPVPDFLYYKDQLEEINELTQRIAALSESLRLKGFYAGGTGDVADVVQTVMSDMDDRALLVPVPLAALGGVKMGDVISWIPLADVVGAIQSCIEVRRQLMQDVYEITGISDIMRGATEAQETLGAQQLKAQFGSVRVKERQAEMQRLALDVIEIKAEIMAEKFEGQDLLLMAQIEDLPTQADLMQQAQQIQQQAMAQLMQVPPEEQQQAIEQGQQQVQEQLQKLQDTVTIDAVMQLLRDERIRPFAIDVETDSTIEPDQIAEKQARSEFMTAFGALLAQVQGALQAAPQMAPLLAEAVRFVAGGFKVPRQMDDAIDEFAEQMQNYQPPPQEGKGEDPEAAKMTAQAAMVKAQADQQKAQADAEIAQAELPIKQQEAALKAQETGAKIELTKAQTQKVLAEIGRVQTEQHLAVEGQRHEMAHAEREFAHEATMQHRQTEHSERMASQQFEADQKARQVEMKRADAESAAKVKSMNKGPTNG